MASRKFIRIPVVERVLLAFKTGWDWIVAKLVTLFLHYAKKLPAERSTEIAEKVAHKFAPILPRTKLARRNLSAAFPKKTADEIDVMVRDVWGHVGRAIAEYVFLDELFDFDYQNPESGRIQVSGIDNFVEIREGKKPVIVFTGHTGNWEILPIAAAAYDLTVTALFRPPNNRFLAKRVLKARRTDKGHLVPSRAGAAWSLARVLEENGTVGLLVDQRFTRGPKIRFFGRDTTGNPLAAKLARQFDADVYPARCIRLPGGKFRIELQDRVDLVRNAEGVIDIPAATQQINAIVEGWVREYPEQWLWLHDRWKIREPAPRRPPAN